MSQHSQAALLLFCWWTGLVLLVVGVPATTLRLTRFSRRGTQVQGSVVQVLVRRRRDSVTVVPVVRFTDPATEREVTGTPAGGRVPQAGWPGQAIAVRYLPGEPERFQIGPQTSVLDAVITSLLVMTLGSVALVLTRWTDPDAIATSLVLGASAFALGAATVLAHRACRSERRTRLRERGVLADGTVVGTFVVDGGAEGSDRYHPVLRFTAARGEEVTGVDLSTYSRRCYRLDGPPVAVRHLSDDPLVFRLDDPAGLLGAGTDAGAAADGKPGVGGVDGAAGLAANTVGAVAVLAFCGVLISVGASLVGR